MKPRTLAALASLTLLFTLTNAAWPAEAATASSSSADVAAASPTVTTESLFREMVDLERLTRFPDPAFRTVQFSSHDRRSNLPGGPGWFANDDGFGGEPIPGFEKVLKAPGPDGIGEYLVADCPGPGAVVRLWSAAISGRVRLYIDDLAHPLYEGDAEPFFRRTLDCFPEGKGLDRALLERTIYQRDASYAPFPFRRRLRIVWIGNLQDIHFYHVNVRLYEGTASVASFKPDDLARGARTIGDVCAALANPEAKAGPGPEVRVGSFAAALAPFEKREIFAASGPQAVRALTIKLTAEDMDKALRATVLHIRCDGDSVDEVQSPIGDFFGAAPGVNPFVSLPLTVRPDGTMTCRFIMPFRESAKIVVENMADSPVNLAGSAAVGGYAWDERRSMHFRARWRVDHGLVASNIDIQDLAFLVARGQGVYVGTSSILMNPCPVPTPGGGWWGEGDEKVFVDGDSLPSTFGTGSEDYYNYSWSSPDIFAYPYCGQPRNDGPGNRGFVTNFRWHILDPLPFRTGLAFFMELCPHERTPGMSYARIAYHYARPGAVDDSRAVKPDDVRPVELPLWEPAPRGAVRDTVFVAAEKALTDPARTILRGARLYAGGAALIWFPEKPGEEKVFRLEVDEAGLKRIHMAFVYAGESGAVSALLDGKPAPWEEGPAAAELFAPGRTYLRLTSLKPADLAAGGHTLTLRFEGARPGIAKPEIGVDFFGIQKVKQPAS